MHPAKPRFEPITLESLCQHYIAGGNVRDVLAKIEERIADRGDDAAWIHRPPKETLLAAAPTDRSLPLFGVPFAVKDNIDVAGWPTSAGCPAYAYVAEADAPAVSRLRAAGAIPIGKTNMDQFATGLTGTRSPYGIPRSVYDDRYVSGGSSSGSAVAVAAGLIPFSLGTDTAGSGRVPAAFNNIVGLKPTRGLIGKRGLVPACQSLDCITIFANSVGDAEVVLAIAAGYDPGEPFSRKPPNGTMRWSAAARIGMPAREQLEFFGDSEAGGLFSAAVDRLRRLRHPIVEIDFTPFRDAARLLYAGPWVAERAAAIESFLRQHGDAMDPTVRDIIAPGLQISAIEAFRGIHELNRLGKLAARQWERMDALVIPTTGTTYTVEAVLAEPVRLNTNLGYYTNFANLLDLCGVAVPAGFRKGNGLPFGVTLLAPAFGDQFISALGREFLGEQQAVSQGSDRIALAVAGAHLIGEPLNYQLTERGAVFVRACRTSPDYRLYALATAPPRKPGLVRSPGFAGRGIEVELWELDRAAFGDFVEKVPPPMAIGTIDLDDGTKCKGFLCEPFAVEGATDITEYGGWLAYLSAGH